jgi:hypothetical protein
MMRCSNEAMFVPTDAWRRLGIVSTEEVRQELLWRIAAGEEQAGGALLEHTAECRACALLLKSFERIVSASRRGDPATFSACPGAAELARFFYSDLSEAERARVAAHLDVCSACREDKAWLRHTASGADIVEIPRRRWPLVVAAVAAAAIFAIVPVFREGPAPSASPYAYLAQMPALDYDELSKTLTDPERGRPLLKTAIGFYEAGDFKSAEAGAQSILLSSPEDPSAEFVVALSRYGLGDIAGAERSIYASERTKPMTHYRCWSALQMALVAGNRERVERECKHLEKDPAYAERVQKIREAVARRSG